MVALLGQWPHLLREVNSNSMPATPNARRPKVRCPKCTALFLEPANSVFECPICSCRLSADGVAPLPFALNDGGKDKALMLEKTVNRSDQKSRVQSETCLREKNATYQNMHPQVSEESRGALLTRVCQEGQGPGAADEESHGVCETNLEQEILLKDGSVEVVHGNKENTVYESSLIANNLAVVNAEAIEGKDSIEIGGSSTRQWDLRSLQSSRCELSFKYSLESDIERKRLPSSKFLSSMLSTKGSEAPLQIPLRVRIASRREESSDHSENGSYSFSSDTETHDGSESDFDFPSPWANGVHDKGLPDSFGQYKSVGHFSEKKLSASPHLLELCDAHEIPNKGQDITDKFSKHVGESDIKFSLQAGDGSFPGSPSKNMNEQNENENEKTCRYDLLSQVKDLTNIMSDAVTFDNNRNPTGDACANITLNQPDTSSLSRLHIQHVSYKGPSKPCFQASDDFDNKQEAGSHSNGKTSSFLPGDLAGLHPLDRSKWDKVIPTHTEAHTRDNNTCDHGLLLDIDVELDLYKHQEIDEWHDEQADDPPSSAYCYELKYQRHDMDLRQMEVHQSAFSDNSLGRIFLPDSLPPNQHLLGGHSSEQIYQVPSQCLMLPASFQLHSMVPSKFHSVPNGCTVCSPHRSCMETHSGSRCMVCPGSVTCSLGHCTRWNCCQPIDGLEPAITSSLVPCAGELTNLNQSHDFLSADMRWKAHLPDRISRYPPLPKDGAAPYVLCNACATVLQIPLRLPPSRGCVQKLRCSTCGRVNKFSVIQCIKQRHELPNLLLPEMSSVSGVRVPYNLHLVQWNPGSLDCSDNHRVPPKSGWQHEGSSGKTSCQDTTPVFTSRSRALPLSLEAGDHLALWQSEFAVDGSINTGLGLRADISDVAICVSSEDEVSGLCEEIEGGERVTPDTSLHGTVNEKDEGLGFGATRISDGESLEMIENGMGSSHKLQILSTFPGVLEADPLKPKVSHDQKQHGLPLLVLLNQESTRFSFSLDPKPLCEEVKSVSWSPVLDSRIPNFVKKKDQSSSRSSKGPKYFTVWLRRSLRDFAKGRE